MKQVISFSLYGDNPKYALGAIKNAQLAPALFPGWEVWFYVGHTVPFSTVKELENTGSTVIPMPQAEGPRATLWRFLPLLESDVDRFISRDCDSILCPRDKAAVDDWIASGYSFHIMRDHPAHDFWMLAGMWGAICSAVPTEVKKQILAVINSTDAAQHGIDQSFLAKHIYPYTLKNACIHDGFTWLDSPRRNFPTPREGLHFIGETFDATGNALLTDREALATFEKGTKLQLALHCKSFIKRILKWKR